MNQKIDQALEKIIAQYPFVGLAISVVDDHQIIYTKSYGVQNIETKEPITPISLFSIASISKTFVATAILQLAEQGKLTLDTLLVTCLPYFHMADPRYQQVTIGQMLSHISGMPDLDDYMWDPPEYDDGALKRFVRSMGKETLEFAPGEKFIYSNTAYDILGQVIAELSCQSFESYIEEHILQPLGMKESTFLFEKASPQLITSPYLCLPDPEAAPRYPYTRSHAPCGSLHSNIMDLSTWAITNLNKGRFAETHVISPASHGLLWQPHALVDEKNPDEHAGLCWFLGKYRGERTISHSGGDIGFTTNLALLPEKSAGVVVLANTYPSPVDVITNTILDTILDGEPVLPKPPIIYALSPHLKTKGLQAALEAYHQIKVAQPDDYEINSDHFNGIGYVLNEIKRPAEAMDILKLGIEICTQADQLHYELARAALQIGDQDLAGRSCQQCLAINPAHWEAAKMLNGLSNH